MSERMYLFFVGAFILASLYIELDLPIYVLCCWLMFEGITDIRLTVISQKLMYTTKAAGLTMFENKQRFDFESLRVLRILVFVMLGGSLILLNQYQFDILWFFPWFMGFAIMGAAISGICPMVLFLRWIGFN